MFATYKHMWALKSFNFVPDKMQLFLMSDLMSGA